MRRTTIEDPLEVGGCSTHHELPSSMLPTNHRFRFLLLQTLLWSTQARKVRITWVNGIGYAPEHMETDAHIISQHFRHPILFCHNPTGMTHEEDYLGWMGDLTQAGTQKIGRITAEVDALVKHLQQAVAAVGPKGRVVHIAHSQGALITSLAAKQLSPDELKRIQVLAFGGAAALRSTPQTPFERCINYYSVNDPLLWIVPSAAQALRSGFDSPEFCFLAPRAGDPVEDHHLVGATYGPALEWEGARFQREYALNVVTYGVHVWMVTVAGQRAKEVEELVKRMLRPVVVLLALLWEWIVVGIRRSLGRESYVPVESIQSLRASI